MQEDLQAHYDVGEAMTFEQMSQIRKNDKEVSLHNPFKEMQGEKNPYVFEDKPVGVRRFVAVNIVGDKFQQKHETKSCMLKVKVSTVSLEQARRMCTSMQEKESRYAIYVLEMFKFVCLPPPDYECDIDCEMNEAISMEYSAMEESHSDFQKRKQTMLDEVSRHNKIAKQIADGELDASEAESGPILPETMLGDQEDTTNFPEDMEPDTPLCSDKFLVLATLKITNYEKMKDCVIIKICGTFESESAAEAHMKTLKKDMKYKLYDVSVCDMYAWLEVPPPYERLENVLFDSNKLTESLGKKKQTININSSELQCPQDAIEQCI